MTQAVGWYRCDPYTHDPAWNLTNRSGETFTVNSRNELTYGPDTCFFYHDHNGNLTHSNNVSGNPTLTCSYDDENQLVEMIYSDGIGEDSFLESAGSGWRSVFTYDGRGRLRQRQEYTWQYGGWYPGNSTTYIYDGMRVIQDRGAIPVAYTRGDDLSGSLEGAGGIGGLLARSHGYNYQTGNWSTHNYYHADGGGNITYLVNSSQGLAASYKYDAYGNTVTTSGALAGANVYRFSSKEWLATPGLYYYGYRWYAPSVQRWPNRDPLGEPGFEAIRNPVVNEYADGPNLYAFVLNDPVGKVDYFGLAPGGPYHPPSGVSLSCDASDSCGRLRAKMTLLMRMIASHTGWDRNMPPPRGGGRHADEIADLWRAYARCQAIHAGKNCQDPRPPRIWERVICRVPGSDEAWHRVAVGGAVVAIVAGGGAIIIGTGGAAAPILAPAF